MSAGIADLREAAPRLVDRYLLRQGSPTRAFWTYDGPGTEPDRLTPLDCLAPNLLSMRLGYAQVIPLFEPSGPHHELLVRMQAVLDDPACRAANFLDRDPEDDEAPFELVRRANRATRGVKGWTAVGVTKVLHRKRPDLVPLLDSVLYASVTGKRWSGDSTGYWKVLWADVRANQGWLEDLRETKQPDGPRLTILRLVDIIIWSAAHDHG